MKRNLPIIASLFLVFVFILSGCGNSQNDMVLGSYSGNSGSTLVIDADGEVTLDGGSSVTKGKWSIKDGVIYITERADDNGKEKADIEASLPSGDKISALTFVQSNTEKGKWTTEIFTKVN